MHLRDTSGISGVGVFGLYMGASDGKHDSKMDVKGINVYREHRDGLYLCRMNQ